jgi:hypothetical protein
MSLQSDGIQPAGVGRELASEMAHVPGLVAKIWLKAPDGSAYGGIYLWRDREAYEAFIAGELWGSVLQDESVSGLESREFAVMGELSRETQPGARLF